jgi:hypothetical protein
MKRRSFIEALALVPAASATALAQQPPAAAPQVPGGPQAPGTGPGGPPVVPTTPDPVTYGAADDAADAVVKYFAPAQFAALLRLGRLFMPAADGAPGAADVGAAQFLDFYIGRSPADRQAVYHTGLDGLNARAQQRFKRPFADTDDTQADAIVMEFLSRAWAYKPADPIEAFLRTAVVDFRRATQNSRPYAATLATPPMTNWLRPL